MYDIQLIKKRISCVVYDDFYFDFASGSGGDVIEFCANYSHHGDRGVAIRELASVTRVISDNIQDTQAWEMQ